MAGRGVLTALVVINVLVNFLNVRDVRIEPYKARLFVEREDYEKLHKDDLQCVITWLKRLTLRDILFDATAGAGPSGAGPSVVNNHGGAQSGRRST